MNRWIELDKYMHRALLQGCTDEEQLKNVSLKYATNYLFKKKLDALAGKRDIEGYKKMVEEIRMFVSCNIIDMTRWARHGKENIDDIDLTEVRRRYASYTQEKRRRERNSSAIS